MVGTAYQFDLFILYWPRALRLVTIQLDSTKMETLARQKEDAEELILQKSKLINKIEGISKERTLIMKKRLGRQKRRN